MTNQKKNELNQIIEKIRQDILQSKLEHPGISQLIENLKVAEGSLQQGDLSLIAMVVGAVLHSYDIEELYPKIYKKILENHEFQTVFIDTLELSLEELGDDNSSPDLKIPVDLSFLNMDENQSKIDFPQSLLFVIEKTIEQLQTILAGPQVVFRDANMVEDQSINILRDSVDLTDQSVLVGLSASRSLEQQNAIHLQIMISIEEESEIETLQATLSWGGYSKMVMLEGKYAEVSFPPIPIEIFYNAEKEQIEHPLKLELRLL